MCGEKLQHQFVTLENVHVLMEMNVKSTRYKFKNLCARIFRM
jgi:hypothetical protein